MVNFLVATLGKVRKEISLSYVVGTQGLNSTSLMNLFVVVAKSDKSI